MISNDNCMFSQYCLLTLKCPSLLSKPDEKKIKFEFYLWNYYWITHWTNTSDSISIYPRNSINLVNRSRFFHRCHYDNDGWSVVRPRLVYVSTATVKMFRKEFCFVTYRWAILKWKFIVFKYGTVNFQDQYIYNIFKWIF